MKIFTGVSVNNEFIYNVYFFRGSLEATKHAHSLITALINNPDVDIMQMLSKTKFALPSSTWDKPIPTVSVSITLDVVLS